MGIKGIYREIGPGERKSLSSLAIEHLEKTKRPLRLAVDISIWQFQVQAAKGGTNPAIRTLFYRLVRLLGHAIQPIFVFDGPRKPTMKRNKRSAGYGGDLAARTLTRRLIRLFGFTVHDAPGEAEAECALLQRRGIVDAVLSEDVDTIMFGCTRTLRNWSAEGGGSRASKTPTHVSVYDTAVMRQKGGGGGGGGAGLFLDREGMVLVALMSGGDYLPEGIPGCGTKVACEAARAGFGRSLCQIKAADKAALAEWKENLVRELRDNESGHFRTRHKALVIPESFPNMEVLRYCTHPVVSPDAVLERLRGEFPSSASVDVEGLREFVRDTFDWAYREGAEKLIRVLAPSLFVQSLLERSKLFRDSSEEGSSDSVQVEEAALIRTITSRRTHFSTDGLPELRVSYVPSEIVKIDLADEPGDPAVSEYCRDGLALNSDDDFEEDVALAAGGQATPGAGSGKKFDPTVPDLIWIPEAVVRLGEPAAFRAWEARQKAKQLQLAAKPVKKSRQKTADMPQGALDKWVKVSKQSGKNLADKATGTLPSVGSSQPPPRWPLARPGISSQLLLSNSNGSDERAEARKAVSSATQSKKPKQKKSKAPAAAGQPAEQTNPWTLAGSQVSPRVTKHVSSSPRKSPQRRSAQRSPIVISSSPGPEPTSPSPRAALSPGQRVSKRTQTPPLENSFAEDPLDGAAESPVPSLPPLSPPRSPQKRRTSPAIADRVSPRKGGGCRPVTRGKEGDNSVKDNGLSSKAVPRPSQMSVKSFGIVSKAGSSHDSTKGLGASDPIELSEDDGEQKTPAATDAKQRPQRNHSSGQASGPAGVEPANKRDDDSPFGPSRATAERDACVPPLIAQSNKVQIYVADQAGYFREVEVTVGEAERLAEDKTGRARRAWLHERVAIVPCSNIPVIDLTCRVE
ncbi:hypothetical protein VTK73DRAFT_1145 [Phialemonium thermophilum]|uniref:Uncharacterized protein n=1 Tax=Phialemonium thermophilum TaxID=223376 RepID=A0ABR3XAV8_9PEZI